MLFLLFSHSRGTRLICYHKEDGCTNLQNQPRLYKSRLVCRSLTRLISWEEVAAVANLTSPHLPPCLTNIEKISCARATPPLPPSPLSLSPATHVNSRPRSALSITWSSGARQHVKGYRMYPYLVEMPGNIPLNTGYPQSKGEKTEKGPIMRVSVCVCAIACACACVVYFADRDACLQQISLLKLTNCLRKLESIISQWFLILKKVFFFFTVLLHLLCEQCF